MDYEGDHSQPQPCHSPLPGSLATPGMVRARPIREKAQILLIRNPGTMTEANACHTRVSKAATATLVVSESGSLFILVALSTVSAST